MSTDYSDQNDGILIQLSSSFYSKTIATIQQAPTYPGRYALDALCGLFCHPCKVSFINSIFQTAKG